MKVLVISCVLVSGSMIFATSNSDVSADQYYSSLDLDGYTLAKFNGRINSDDDGSHEVFRKRSHRRKRIIRPPARGK